MEMDAAPINKTNLIVNYLPQNFTDGEFADLFSNAGHVTASKIIRDRASGYSYGFGFIDYATEEEAANAIDMLNGYQLQHKRIKVSYARQGENVKGANLYLRNLPKEVTEKDLENIFHPYGHIVQTRVLVDANGQSRGVGFVLFSTKEQAQLALDSTDNKLLPGFSQPISVKFAEDNRLKMRPNPMAPISATNVPLGYQGIGGGILNNYTAAANFGGVGPMRNQIRARFNPMMGVGPGGMMPAAAAAPNHMNPMITGASELGFVLFVYNIGTETDEFALWQMFSPFGTVQKVSVMRDRQNNNKGKGFGFVTMANYSEAVGAIHSLNGQDFCGNKLQVSFKN